MYSPTPFASSQPAMTFKPYRHVPVSPHYDNGGTTPGLHTNLVEKCHQFTIPTQTNSKRDATITDCRYIGSYNWVSDHNSLSIIMPGSPREWREQSLPYPLRPDGEGHYREQYDKRMRSTPLLPLLLAVNNWHERTHAESPKFPWHKVDFVTNRNSLRNLLRTLPKAYNTTRRSVETPFYKTGWPPKPFRIDIELAGTKTIILSRWDSDSAFEVTFPNSYGFNFEHAFTREAEAVSSLDESGETARHHRVNSYNFGGLQLVVRSEIDACLSLTDSLSDEDLSPIDSENMQSPPSRSLRSNSILTPYGLTIIPSHNPPTPQTDLIELSTIKEFKSSWLAEERYPQLFLSQVPNHYLAYHYQGNITRIEKRDLQRSPEIQSSAGQMRNKLNQLRELLLQIQSMVLAHAYRSRERRRCFSLVYTQGQLALYERVGERRLPNEAFAMFDMPF